MADMIEVSVRIQGVSPYSGSKYIDPELFPKLKGETADAWDARLWRERLHIKHVPECIAERKKAVAGQSKTMPRCADGCRILLPSQGFVLMLRKACAMRGEKIAGRGQKTYKDSFMAGLMCDQDADTGISANSEEIEMLKLHVPSDGKTGGGKRVMRRFPVIQTWSCEAAYTILDPTIIESVFRDHLQTAGLLVGLGRFRPERGGYYGRFQYEFDSKTDWRETAL